MEQELLQLWVEKASMKETSNRRESGKAHQETKSFHTCSRRRSREVTFCSSKATHGGIGSTGKQMKSTDQNDVHIKVDSG
jgi:hypothetical protein